MRMLKGSFPLVLSFALLAAGPARAQDYVESFDGPLTSVMLNGALTTGVSGAWATEVRDGALVLSNAEAPNAVRYISLENVVYPNGTGPTSTNNASVEVSVRVNSEERAAAGVIASFDPRTTNYILFAVNDRGAYFLTRKEQNRVKVIAAGTSAAINRTGVNKVAATTKDRAIVLSVNGTEVARVPDPSPAGAGAGRPSSEGPRFIGLGAFGRGSFSFDDVRISPAFSAAIRSDRSSEDGTPPRRSGAPGDTVE